MSSAPLNANEKLQQVAALQASVLEEPAEETPTHFEKEAYAHHHQHHNPTTTTYAHDGQFQDQASVENEPVNELATTRTTESTGPPYSVFTTREKRFIILLTATAGFFSPLSANIYFPALNSLAADLHVSETLINLTLTSYMIFQGIAPTLVGDLADAAGRRPAYLIGFVIYIGACVGIALQNSFAALFILRCLQSAGSSGTVALGSGVVADISTSAERGTYMGWATAGILVGPAIGPVCC